MIIGVALKNRKSDLVISLLKPNRHSDVIRKIVDDLDIDQVIGSEWIQGFITDTGKFLDRRTAAEYALECGQIKMQICLLFSEDLW